MFNRVLSLLCFLIGLLGLSKLSWIMAKGCKFAWHPDLVAPFFAPPKWVFGVVWPMLYALLAVAAWMIWEKGKKHHVTNTMVLFGTHMFLNLAWAPLYFCTKSVLLGLVLSLLVLYMAVINYRQFRKLEPLAGQLMIPYIVWVSYAVILCASYFVINSNCACFSELAEMLKATNGC